MIRNSNFNVVDDFVVDVENKKQKIKQQKTRKFTKKKKTKQKEKKKFKIEKIRTKEKSLFQSCRTCIKANFENQFH